MTLPAANQLTLGVSLDDEAKFANYVVNPANEQALSRLSDNHRPDQYLYVWGSGSPGLSHLLQAACQQAALDNQPAIYIPLSEKSQFSPEIVSGADALSLVCIDDMDQLNGDAEWELALFNAFNLIIDSNTRLIIAAKMAPAELDIRLHDLHSRLQSGLVFQLTELSDDEKLIALQLRARNRGMQLADAVAEFILLRAERSLAGLMAVLDKLDESSLRERRSLTIPLVKSTMGW